MAIEEKKFLGTAAVEQLITNTRSEISTAEQAAKDYADSLADNYDPAGTASTKVQELANGQVKTNTDHIGTMDNLETTAKGDLVNAINEVRNAVSAGGTAAAITMEEKTSDLGEGVAKAYVLKQGTNTVGTINIPKDMVVQSGEVVVDPAGQAAGTYIKLTLANATNDVIFVNVGTLVDIYKAKANAAQIQMAIDSATREISATIVAGSVTSTELAANAVVTAKIADGNVTKAKLATDVQNTIDDVVNKAHEHANKAKLDTYDKTQTELIDGLKEYVDGLQEASEEAVTEALGQIRSNKADKATTLAGYGITDAYTKTQVESALTKLTDDKADKATTLAGYGITDGYTKTEVDGAINTLENGKVADLRTDVDALKSVSYVEITAAEINAMFNA